MGRWVGQKMAKKIGYPLWMAPYWQKFFDRVTDCLLLETIT